MDRDFVESILSIYLPKAPTESETRANIFIDYISMNKLGVSILLPAEEINVKLRTDTGHMTRKWMKNPSDNLGVVVNAQIENNHEQELDIGRVGTSEGPYLQLSIQEGGRRSRVKRTTRQQSLLRGV